jgi:hypothetical protein
LPRCPDPLALIRGRSGRPYGRPRSPCPARWRVMPGAAQGPA